MNLPVCILMLAASGSFKAFADVNPVDGSYLVEFEDLKVRGELPISISRVYHSESAHDGWFGIGWNSDYETRLHPDSDRKVTIFEKGGGTRIEYLWKENAFVSTRFPGQRILKSKTGYIRHLPDAGRNETYDTEGRLTQITDVKNNRISFQRNREGKVVRISDRNNRNSMTLEWEGPHVKSIVMPSGKSAKYAYNPQGELVMSRDQAMNSHLYSYEADSRHYLNRITVGGKILQKVTYVASGGPRKVAKVQDEIGGTEEEYSYEGTAPRITVTIAKKESDGSKSKEVLSYEKPANGSDEPHLSKRNLFESETPGEIRYRACCELPEVIKIGEDEARFEYDESNRLVKKQTPTFTQTIEYEDGQSLAVASVTTKRADTGVATTVRAQHDKNGNLTGLTLPDGRKFALKYDSRNRLSHYSYANPKRNLDEMFIVKYDENTNDLIIANPEIGLARIPEDYDLFKNLKSTSPVAKAMTLYSAALVRLNEAREQLLVTLSYNPEEDL